MYEHLTNVHKCTYIMIMNNLSLSKKGLTPKKKTHFPPFTLSIFFLGNFVFFPGKEEKQKGEHIKRKIPLR